MSEVARIISPIIMQGSHRDYCGLPLNRHPNGNRYIPVGSQSLTVISFLLVIAHAGYTCQLQFFFNTNFLVNFSEFIIVCIILANRLLLHIVLFLFYGISMVPLAFFTTVFIHTVKAAGKY